MKLLQTTVWAESSFLHKYPNRATTIISEQYVHIIKQTYVKKLPRTLIAVIKSNL